MSYVRIAFLALLAAAVATALWYRGQAIKADAESVQLRADLATAASVNQQNQQAIKALRESFLVANALAKELAEQVEQIDAERDAATDELNALRNADNEVDTYLKQPVPPALSGMYDRKTGGAGSN